MNKRFHQYLISTLIGIMLLLGLWVLITYVSNIPSYILPTPIEVWNAFGKEHLLLLRAMYITGFHALIGFLAAALFGFLVAWLFSISTKVYQAFHPWLLTLQLIPSIVLSPILILWFGHGTTSVIVIAFLICFFPVVVSTATGLRSTPHAMQDLFRLLHASNRQTFFRLKLPHALPYYLSGLRVAATLAPVGAITGDLFLGSSAQGNFGLGYLVTTYYSQLKIPALFATALISCFLGFLFVFCVYLLDWYFLHSWHDSYHKNH